MEEWKNSLFSDESRRALRDSDGRQRVYRCQNGTFASCAISVAVGYQGGSIIVWEGIPYEARTHFLCSIEAMDRSYIRGECSSRARHTFRTIHGDNFRFMNDNARCYTARSVTENLNEVAIHAVPI